MARPVKQLRLGRIALALSMLTLPACGSRPVEPTNVPAAPPQAETPKSRAKPPVADAKPLKGKFLDYIYQIRPDHRAEGYAISTSQLSDGYAFASGPYDGVFFEFFLFRGLKRDLVIEQASGSEVAPDNLVYGYAFDIFAFENGKKTELDNDKVLPLKEIEKLFDSQIEEMKKQKDGVFANWSFYKTLRLPKEGTTTLLLVCRDAKDPVIGEKAPCATVGTLAWNKLRFVLKKSKDFKVSEVIL